MSRRRDVIEVLENEDEVLKKAKNGCRDSMEVLYRQYLPFLRGIADKTERCYSSVEFDDAFQQATIYFMEAARTYQDGMGTGFRYWVVKCVSLQMISFWKTQTTIRIPKWPGTDELREASVKCGGVVRFSEISKRDKASEVLQMDPNDKSAVQPIDAAIASEEAEILESAIEDLEPLDRILVRGRLAGKFYEDCGKDVCRKLGVKISTHRESVRQRASRAFSRLESCIFRVIELRRRRRTKTRTNERSGIAAARTERRHGGHANQT